MSKKGKKSKYEIFKDNDSTDHEEVTRDDNGFIRLHKKEKPAVEKRPFNAGYNSILYSRIDHRKIPKVDAGIKDPDKNISDDALKEYYRTRHIAEYVHMERVERERGMASINRIKFEFSYMFSGYMKTEADLGDNAIIHRLSYAEVSKKSFINKLNNSLRYINYFIEYFDDDDELMTAYFNMMMQIMSNDVNLDPETFVENLYAYFSTDSLIEKIARMVEYNTDETLIKKTDRTYDESIQLTVDHLKAIMAVSCIHKFIIPIVGHYYFMKSRFLKEANITDKDLYLMAFGSFMSTFDDYYDVELYEKLYCTAGTRIKKTNQEQGMWRRRYRFGTTTTSYANQLMKDFIVDISQKAVFGLSAIIFIHVCFDNSIKTELIQPDKWEFTEMKMEANDSVNETMTRWDKWQTDKSFHSQKDRIRAYVSIKDGINWLGRMVGINFEDLDSDKPKDIKRSKELREEFNYYRDNIVQPMSNAQMYLILQYYSSMIGCMADSDMLEMKDIFKLIMIMKRDFEARNFNYLRFFISSSMIPASDHRYSKRRLEKLFQIHPSFDEWISQYPDTKVFNISRFYDEVRPIVSTPIKVCDYKYQEYNDHKMYPVDQCVVDEVIRLMINL